MNKNEKEKTFTVYNITQISSGKKYVGHTYRYQYRKYTHQWLLKSNKHYNKLLQNYWNKYGESDFIFSVFKDNLTLEEALDLEQKGIEEGADTLLLKNFNIL